MKYISDGKLSINGQSYPGVVKELTLPNFEAKTEDFTALGRYFDTRLTHGIGVIEMSFTVIDGVIPLHGLVMQQNNFEISGFQMSTQGRTFSNGYTIMISGRITGIEGGTLNRSEAASTTVTVTVDAMEWTADGQTIVNIDTENNKYDTPFGDQLVDYRNL